MAEYMVADRRSILKSFAVASMGAAIAIGRAGAQDTSEPSQGHMPREATPQAGGGPEPLLALLRCVPESMLDAAESAGIAWYYADIAQQFAAMNLAHTANGPAWEDEPWLPATMTLATASSAYTNAFNEDFIGAIGFQPLGVDQTLLAGAPPTQVTLFRGGLDRARLEAAWQQTGYVETAVSDGVTVWSIGEEGEFEIDHPVQRVVFAAFNNLAVLNEGVLACAPTKALLEEVIAVSQTGEGSILDDPVTAAALDTLPATTVSAMGAGPLLGGAILSPSLDAAAQEALFETLAESDAEVGPMPISMGVVIGVTAGAVAIDEDLDDAPYDAPDFSAGEGLALVRLVMRSPGDAEQAVSVVDYRWNTMNSLYTEEPYSELMEIVSTSAEGNVAAIDFAQVRSPTVWRNLLITRDVLPFVPSSDG
jgi:hypothetical protein